MKTSKYLSAIMFISAIWILLDVQSPAQGFSLELPFGNLTLAKSLQKPTRTIAQNSAASSENTAVNKDLRLQDINITRDSTDKSLLTIAGSINNQSEQPHYVYYIVAKFISKDTSIKQTIIPVNINLEPGESKLFTHEISTTSSNSILLETVKPVVVKYEYR
ncbi:hypothetical protein [Chamaesiphon sp. VAR_48_metabat_135_sub]|uniref:hypothetical protein n=1 Tax=Chamaesiphon sp. VAR_48_metabat_135_sub TaxID=2964699 RepID=UPI00286A1B43|nr:hypothetical protein [Chamaesiphon sp. VAR_48_metabat_135_sub]